MTTSTPEPIECNEENAARFLDWCRTRGGVARWRSVNLSNPGASWSTPALTPERTPTPRPTWQADNQPEAIESDPTKIIVFAAVEVKRLRIAIKRGDSFNLTLTDASSRRVRKAVADLGDGAFYRFDGGEAVIFQSRNVGTLADWAAAHQPAALATD